MLNVKFLNKIKLVYIIKTLKKIFISKKYLCEIFYVEKINTFFLTKQNGDTVLHIAAAMARKKLTKIILQAKCNTSLKNKVI